MKFRHLNVLSLAWLFGKLRMLGISGETMSLGEGFEALRFQNTQ